MKQNSNQSVLNFLQTLELIVFRFSSFVFRTTNNEQRTSTDSSFVSRLSFLVLRPTINEQRPTTDSSFVSRLSFVVLRPTTNDQRTTNIGTRRIYSLLFVCALLLGSVQGWGQIAQRGSATTAISTSPSVTVNKPSGVVAGDLMIANIGNYVSGNQSSASCSGWTLIAGTDIDRGRASLLYKVAGESEPENYTFNVTSSSNPSIGAIIAFSGVDDSNPFDVAAASSWTTATNSSISNIPSITTQRAGAAIVIFGNASRLPSTTTSNLNFGTWTLTNPSSLTELYDVGSTGSNNMVAVGAAWGIRSSVGSTGAGGFTCTVNTHPRVMGGIMIALRPKIMYRSANASGGTWTTAADWQRSTDGGTTWTTATDAPTTTNSDIVTIRNGFDMAISGSVTADQVTVEAGATVNVTGTATLTIADGPGTDFTVNGTLNRTSSNNIVVNGTLAFPLSTSKYISNSSGAAIPTASWGAASTLQIDASIADNEFTESFGNVIVNGVSSFNMVTGATNPTIQGNLTISTTSGTVALSNSGASGSTLTVGGDFEINGNGGTFIIDNISSGSANNISKKIIVTGNYIQSNGTFNFSNNSNNSITSNQRNAQLDVSGDFSHTGGAISETAADNDMITRINLIGTSATTFTTTGQTGRVEVVLNKTATAPNDIVALYANTNIDHLLTLTDGLLNLSTFNLTLGASATISGGSTGSMIIPEGSGEIRKVYTAAGSFVFPVGDITGTREYTPVTINVTAGSGFNSAYVGVSLEDKKHDNNFSATNFLTRSWKVTQSGITGCTATIIGTYINSSSDVNGTLASIRAAQLNGVFNQQSNPWLKTGGSVLSGTTFTYTGASLTSGQTSVFTGITSANPTVSIAGGNQNVCQNASVILTANSSGDGAFTYVWSNSLGTNSTATPPTSSVGSANYTVTVKDANGVSSAASASVSVTVTAAPNAGTLSGTQIVCAGSTTTFSSDGGAGSWTSSNTSIATVNSSTGVVTGVAAGTATITYTVTGTGGCSNATATRTVTVNSVPSAPTASGLQTFCSGATVANLVASGTAVKWYTAASGGSEVSSSTALATQYYYASQTVNGCESNRAAVAVRVNTSPTAITASVSGGNNTVCADSSITLNTTAATFGTNAATLLSEDFNGSLNGWTTINNSTGGTLANAAWTLQPGNYSYQVSTGSTVNFNNASQFYLSNSDEQGSGTTATILQSPPFSTIGVSAANLTFSHHYNNNGAGDSARVEISLDGTTWSSISASLPFTQDNGTVSGSFSPYTLNFKPESFSLPAAYLNKSTVYIRFKYDATFDWYWAIDNVSVTGNYSSASGYAWTSSPAGFTSSSQNPSVAPSQSTTYTVTASNPNGCTSTSSVAVTVIPNKTVTLTSAVGSNAQSICIGNAISTITYSTTVATGATFSGLPSGVTGSWDADVVTISGTPSVAGTFNYTVTLTGGCGSVTAIGSITVTDVNTITRTSAPATTNQTVCQNAAITNITYATTNATGATFSNLPAGVSGSWASNVVTISGNPSVAGSYNYTITLTGGCTVVTATGTILVNEIPTAFTVTGGGAFCSGGGGNVVGLENTQIGVNYQLVRDGATNVGSPVAGTGSAISFGAQATAGNYTIIGTNTTSGCTNPMSNTVSVSVTALASAPVIASITQPTCTVATATINLSGLPTGSWTVVRYPGAVPTTGSGSTASYDNLAANTTYTFTVTPNGGCTSPVSANAEVNAQPTTPAAPTAGNNSRCGTGTVVLTATVAEGVTVDWYSASTGGPVLAGGTGTTSFTSPSISSTTSYYAQARTVSGNCLSNVRTEVIATVNPLPTITASSTAASVSYGTASTTLAYTAVSNNPTTYSITWNSSPSNSLPAVTNQNLSGSPITISIPSVNVGTYTGNLTVSNGIGCTSTNRTFTLTVNTVPLTISGISAEDKVYDGNSAAALTGTASYVGLQNGDNFTVSGTPNANFDNKDVGANKTVTVTGYTAPSSNYTVTQPSLTASITPAPLTITADEVFKTTGTPLSSTPITGSTAFFVEGLVGSETVSSVTITYGNGAASNAAAGTYTNSVVPSAAVGLNGFAASNYSITYVPANLVVGNFIHATGSGGNWNSTSTWSNSDGGSSCNCIPGATDIVLIRGNRTVTVNVTNAVCARMELGGTEPNQAGLIAFAPTGNPKLTIDGQLIVGGSGSTNPNRRGEVDLIGGATLEVEELILTRSTSGNDNPGIFDMTGGGTLIVGTISVGQGTVTWTPSTGTVIMKSTSTLPSASSVASFHNLTINSGVITTSGTNISVGGNFTVNGTFVPGATNHLISGAGTLTGSGVVDVTLVSASALTAQYSITNRTLTNLTVEYVGAGNQSMLAATYGGLVTGGSGTKTMLDNITVNNDVLIGAGSTLSAGSNRTLNVKGNFTTIGTFSPASGTVAFNGGGSQTISGTTSFYNFSVSSNTASNITLASGSTTSISNAFTPNGTSFGNITGSTVNFNGTDQNIPAFTFYDLAINGGGTKTLEGQVTVADQLTLTSGLVSIGNNDLLITAGNANAITGGGTTSYIVTGGTGAVKYTIGGAGSYTVPVGSATAYNPFGVEWTTAPGITRLDVRYIPSSASTGTGLPTNVFGCQSGAELLTNGYWSVSAQGTLSSNPKLNLTRRGHGNAGVSRSAHGIVRRNNASSDWFVAGVWSDNGNNQIVPASTGPVSMNQEMLDAFGEIAIAKGIGNSSVGIWTGEINGNAENAANWGCNTVPTSEVDVVIPRNVRNNPTIINGDISGRNFIIQDGAKLIMAGSRNITLSNTGVFTNNGIFDGASVGTVTFQGTGAIAGTSATTFNNVVLNGAVTLTTVPTINGNLQMNDNASVSAAPNYGSDAVLVYNNTNSSSTGNEWTGNGSSRTAGLPNTIRISGSGTISLSGNRSVPGTLQLNGGTLDVQSHTLSLYDGLSISGGSFNTGAAGTVSYVNTSAGQSIVATNYPSLSFSNFNKTLSSTGTIGIAGTFTPGTGAHTTTGSTISFNGSGAQNIPAFSYNNLTIAGSNTKTAATGLTIAGTVTISSTFDAGANSHTINGNWVNNGTITHGGGTLQFNGTTTISGSSENTFNNVLVTGSLTGPNANLNVAGNWTVNGGTFTPGTGTVTFNNTQAPQYITGAASAFNFNNLVVANSGQTIILQGTPIDRKSLNLTGNLTLSSGTFNAVFTDVDMAVGNWTNNGATFSSGGSKVTFSSASGNQEINGTAASQTFERLTMNKPGRVLSLSGTTRLIVTDTFALVAGTYDAGTTDSLRIGKNWIITGGTFTAGNSTVAFDGESDQTIPVQTYYNLSVQGSGVKTAAGNITLTNEINIASGKVMDMGNNRLIDGGTLTSTGSGTLKTKYIGNDGLPNGKTWSFGVAFEGDDAQTVNFGTYNGGLIVNNNGSGASMNGNTTAASVTLSAGDLTINANTLTLNGSFNGSANNALRGSAASNLTVATGASAGILFFRNGGTFNYLKNFSFAANASATLGNRLNITAGAEVGKVQVAANSSLASNGNLVLKSDTLGSAYVAEIEGCTTCSPITGEVEVERAMPNKRTWRLVTIPVTGNYTLRQQLTRQGPGAAVEYPAPYCNGSPAPAASGYGTMITAHSMSSCANAAEVGGDLITTGGHSSVRRYTHINNAGSWASNNGNNFVNFNAVPDQEGYLVFVRGDRSQLGSGSNATTFRFKGNLRQGNTASTTSVNAAYGVVSNPYAAPINIEDVFANNTGNEDKFARNIWVWDGDKTGSNGFGGYRSLSYDGQSGYICGDCEGNQETQQYLTLNTGQAFMLQRKSTVSTSVSLTVKESDKVADGGNVLTMRRFGARTTQSIVPHMRVRLYRANGSNLETFVDATTARFSNIYKADPNEEYDVYKYNNNTDENISLVRSNKYLAIESRPVPTATDTLYIPFWSVTNRGYALSIQTENLASTGLTAVLIDSFTSVRTPIPMNGTNFVYPFTVTSNAASKNLSRFRVVFTPGSSLPVTFTNVRAYPKANGVNVEWDVVNEENLSHYEIERSTDGNQFSKIAVKQAMNQTAVNYMVFDNKPVSGINYYRIRSVDQDGTFRFSAIMRVSMGRNEQGIDVYPTKVSDNNINIAFTDQPAGVYNIQLVNAVGQVSFSKQVTHSGGTSTQTLNIGSENLPSGLYYLNIDLEKGTKKTVKLFIQR